MAKFGSVLAIIMGIILAALCGFALVRGMATAIIIVGLVAGVLAIILGIVLMIRNKKNAENETDEDEIED